MIVTITMTISTKSATANRLRPSSDEAWSPTVFDEKRWFRYNVTGTDHQVWPTYDVYLLRRGGSVHKVQVIGYYGPAGEARRISFRYVRLDG